MFTIKLSCEPQQKIRPCQTFVCNMLVVNLLRDTTWSSSHLWCHYPPKWLKLFNLNLSKCFACYHFHTSDMSHSTSQITPCTTFSSHGHIWTVYMHLNLVYLKENHATPVGLATGSDEPGIGWKTITTFPRLYLPHGVTRLSVSLISFVAVQYKMLVGTRTKTNEWT